MAESDRLTPTQTRALAALLTERDTRAASKAARVSESTLRRWLRRPDFRLALAEAERAALETVVRRLAALGAEAADTLGAIMRDASAGPGARVQAASVALNQLARLREVLTLEQRVIDLERSLQHVTQKPTSED